MVCTLVTDLDPAAGDAVVNGQDSRCDGEWSIATLCHHGRTEMLDPHVGAIPGAGSGGVQRCGLTQHLHDARMQAPMSELRRQRRDREATVVLRFATEDLCKRTEDGVVGP